MDGRTGRPDWSGRSGFTVFCAPLVVILLSQKECVLSLLENDSSCIFAFVVEKEAYKFSTLDLDFLQNRTTVPVVLDWAVGNETCKHAWRNQTSYAFKATYSTCQDSENGPGYRCICSSGFQGNPYVIDGCQGTNTNLSKFSMLDFICKLILLQVSGRSWLVA